jgi:2-polyprenyl-3-methyl-5-hydroxy-6-metoxy-1,4-benzoquinol methylase
MAARIYFTHCPLCNSSSVFPVLSAKDYTVSGETFEVWHCDDCSNRFTQSIPSIEDIGPFYQSAAYVSHSDTKKGFVNSVYHIVRNYTLGAKKKLVQNLTAKKTGTLLDVGAGTGSFSHTMASAGWAITGLEPDSNAREVAQNKYGLSLLPADQLFALPENQFDLITLWHVLEHVHALHDYLKRFHDLLKPGGKIIIAVPNYTSKDAYFYKECWAAYDVPRHLYHFSPKGMEMVLKNSGFQMNSLRPMWFDSFYVAMLSEQYKAGSGNLPGAFWQGLLSNSKAFIDPKKGSSIIYAFEKI